MSEVHPLLDVANAFLNTHAEWERQTQDEIRLLRTREIKAAEEIMKRKPAITDMYQAQLKHLFNHREALGELPENTRDALRQSQASFVELSAEYQKELDMALTSAERLMNLIKDTIVQERSTSQFYGKSGALMAQEAPRSITINKKA